jgi:5'-nucleotidase
MIILLTNDDGINEPNFQFTKSILQHYGDVYVVAPRNEQSGKSMALSITPIKIDKIDDMTYTVEGTPVDCVNFALGGLKLKPDLIVSGCNNGYNLGFDTRYSGTLGACFQGQYYHFNTLALSAQRGDSPTLKNELKEVLDFVFEEQLLSGQHTISINFPLNRFKTSKGIKKTDLYYVEYEYKSEFDGYEFKALRKRKEGQNIPSNSDSFAIRNGYISYTKITL